MTDTLPKTKVLFVSWMSVHDNVSHAGGKTLNYYLSRFSESPGFEIRLCIAGPRHSNDLAQMVKQLSGKIHIYHETIPVVAAAIRKLYYKYKLNYYLCYLNAKFAHLDFVSLRYFSKLLNSKAFDSWSPDLVVLEWPEMLCLYEKVHTKYPYAKVIISEVDVAFQRYSRRISARPIAKSLTTSIYRNLKQFELQEIAKVDHVVVQSLKDKKLLVCEGVKENKIFNLVPYYSKYFKTDYTNTKDILFWGAMSRPENIEAALWFIENVFSVLSKTKPDLRFIVLGGGEKSVLASIGKHKGVIATGFVLDPSSYFNDCCCLVAPLVHGAGIKVKVIEGMAAGLPVLTGEVGIEGINAFHKKHYFHCETADDYISTIDLILSSPAVGEAIGKNSRQLIEQIFSYESSFFEYRKLLSTMHESA